MRDGKHSNTRTSDMYQRHKHRLTNYGGRWSSTLVGDTQFCASMIKQRNICYNLRFMWLSPCPSPTPTHWRPRCWHMRHTYTKMAVRDVCPLCALLETCSSSDECYFCSWNIFIIIRRNCEHGLPPPPTNDQLKTIVSALRAMRCLLD